MATPMLVRNMESGPTVFSDEATKIQIEWQRAGDPNGDDIQQVPVSVMENVNFMRCIKRGVFKIEEATPEVESLLSQQGQGWRDRMKVKESQSVTVIDQEANNDLVSVPCIGPSERGGGECHEPVAVKEKAKNAKPPLCSRHIALADQFIQMESDQIVDGKAEIKWQRIAVGARETPQT